MAVAVVGAAVLPVRPADADDTHAPAWRDSVAVHEAAGDSLGVARGLDGLLESGEVEEFYVADALARRALRIYSTDRERHHFAIGNRLIHLASMQHRRRVFVEALRLYEEVLALRRAHFPPSDPEVIRARANVATVLGAMGAYVESEREYRDILALKLAAVDGPDEQIGSLHLLIAWTLMRQERWDEADEACVRGIEARRAANGDEDVWIAHGQRYRAHIAIARGEHDRAEAMLREHTRRYEHFFGSGDGYRGYSSIRRVETERTLGTIDVARGDHDAAERHFARAALAFERSRQRMAYDETRSRVLDAPHELWAATLLELDRPVEAWRRLEEIRGRTLQEMILAERHGALDEDRRRERDRLAQGLSEAEATLARTLGSGDESETKARQALREAQDRWDAFQRGLRAPGQDVGARAASIADVQGVLDADEAILGWLDAEFGPDLARRWLYVVRSDRPVRWYRLEDRGASLVDDLTAALAKRGESVFADVTDEAYDAAARALWRSRVQPAVDDLRGVRSLIVVPSPSLARVAIEGLRDAEGVFLGDRFDVSYTPSATLGVWLRSREPEAPSRGSLRSLLVGDPVLRPGRPADDATLARADLPHGVFRDALDGSADALARLPRLHGARREVQSLAALVDRADVFLGERATEGALVDLQRSGGLARYDVVHLATHALIDDVEPGRSTVVLSPEPDGAAPHAGVDGRLTRAEIARGWALDADLVTLSGCRTAGGPTSAEGTLGLANTLLQRGARCALVSLWDVHDEATARLMESFYEHWLGARGARTSRATALRRAKQELRAHGGPSRPFDHPYYWAGFVLIGDGR